MILDPRTQVVCPLLRCSLDFTSDSKDRLLYEPRADVRRSKIFLVPAAECGGAFASLVRIGNRGNMEPCCRNSARNGADKAV